MDKNKNELQKFPNQWKNYSSQFIQFAKIILITFLFFSCGYTGYELTDIGGDLSEKLDATLRLEKEYKAAPSGKWYAPHRKVLGTDKPSIENDINELLNEAIELLGKSEALETKRIIQEKQLSIKLLNAKIGELNSQKLLAPEEVAFWKIWKDTVSDIKEQIDYFKEHIRILEREIQESKYDLIKDIEHVGISISADEADTLIYSITGDDEIKIIIVFNNIKKITKKLEMATVSQNENIDTAKKYYGMHTVLLKILLKLHGHYISKVRDNYIPKIDGIIKENAMLILNTQKYLASASKEHKEIYNANLNAQTLTANTAKLYKDYLMKNQSRIEDSKRKIEDEYKASKNTYDTVISAHTLIILMRESDNFYKSLSSLQVPQLIKFKNDEMRNEFKKLTLKLES
jgi:hypothetical protein